MVHGRKYGKRIFIGVALAALEVPDREEHVAGEGDGVDEGEDACGDQHVRVELAREDVVVVEEGVLAVQLPPSVDHEDGRDEVQDRADDREQKGLRRRSD